MPGSEPALRILHVSADLVFGGVENWLLNMVRLLSSPSLHMDFAVTGTIDPRVQARFESLGARVFPCPSTYQPRLVARNLRQLLRQHGPYDILHSHMHRGNAHVALAARLAGIPSIVVHSHLDTSVEDAGWATAAKAWIAGILQRVCAHKGLACGIAAGDCLFDSQWRTRNHWGVHYCGIDLAPFTRPVDRLALRQRLGIPPHAYVIGNVGRCEPVKNQEFILDLAARYTPEHPDAVFVIVGDGALRPRLEERASSHVRILGAREDVPELLLGLFDVFLLPSLAEGLPISLLEAQAAGLPAVISDRTTAEARLLPAIEALSIHQPPAGWCAALHRARGKRIDPLIAQALLRDAGFGVQQSAQRLERHYRELYRPSSAAATS